MGFFKKRGRPRQYRIVSGMGSAGGVFYDLEVWTKFPDMWVPLTFQSASKTNALDTLRRYAVLDAKVNGYGDNYEITEVL